MPSSSEKSAAQVNQQVNQVLHDPKQLEQLTERVYVLIQETLRRQQEQIQPDMNRRGI